MLAILLECRSLVQGYVPNACSPPGRAHRSGQYGQHSPAHVDCLFGPGCPGSPSVHPRASPTGSHTEACAEEAPAPGVLPTVLHSVFKSESRNSGVTWRGGSGCHLCGCLEDVSCSRHCEGVTGASRPTSTVPPARGQHRVLMAGDLSSAPGWPLYEQLKGFYYTNLNLFIKR